MHTPSRPPGFRTAVLTLAFGSGFGVLAMEIAGARLLAPTYGLSTIPWTAILSVVLTGLALGNAVGGRLADRSPVPLFVLVALAGLTPFVAVWGGVLAEAALQQWGFLRGAVATSAVFFGPPSLLLGMVTPYLVRRYTAKLEEVGARAGEVSAAATVGGIVGSLVTGFVLLPALPLSLILCLVGGFLFLLAALAAELEGRRRSVVFGLAVAAPAAAAMGLFPGERSPEVVYEGQSLHAAIRVVDSEWFGGVPVRELWQNGSRSSVEILSTGEPAHQYQVSAGWLVESRLDEVESLLVLGGAANSFPVAMKRWQPRLRVDVVEIDPQVVEVAREYFAYGSLPPDALGMYVEDARHFLRRRGDRYDIIFTDVYDNLFSLPWTMVTQEAFQEKEARLSPHGFVMMTVTTPIGGPGALFLRRLLATAESVFPHVRIHPARRMQDVRRTREVLLVMARDPDHLPEAELSSWSLEPQGPPFTDRHAPVEYLQAHLFLHDPAWR